MPEMQESEFHSCICSKLEKLTLAEELGQSWKSISVCISFGDYKKMFEIDKKDLLLLPTEIGNIPGNGESQIELHLEEQQEESKVDDQSESAVNIPVSSTSNQDFDGPSVHLNTTGRNSKKKRKRKALDSASEPNVSPLPTHSKRRPNVEPLSNETTTSTTNNTNQCQTCSKQFSTKYSLNLHQKRIHSDEQTKANWKHECDICYKKFPYLPFLKTHKLVHTKKRQFKCPKCPTTFKYKGHLVRHLKTHEKDSPFRCKMCQKVLSSSARLESHIRTHTGEKPYQCQFCDKSFAYESVLKTHQQRLHISLNNTTLN